jgi:hypothetical protein
MPLGAPLPPPPQYPPVLLPVVWFNQAFDLLLLPFGPLGRWFQGRSGRALLGVVGLLCLVAAAALAAADGIDWTR